MSLLDLATLASGLSDVLAWTRHLLALRSSPPHPHWHFRHRKLDIGHGWLRYESETASRSEPRRATIPIATARPQKPSIRPGTQCCGRSQKASETLFSETCRSRAPEQSVLETHCNLSPTPSKQDANLRRPALS